MKLLVAVQTSDHRHIADNALRWVPRAGYDFKLFIKGNYLKKFGQAVLDANYHYYLALDEDVLVANTEPRVYAEANGYDLLLCIPDKLKSWTKGKEFVDGEIVAFCQDVGLARLDFSKHKRLLTFSFPNGSLMERI